MLAAFVAVVAVVASGGVAKAEPTRAKHETSACITDTVAGGGRLRFRPIDWVGREGMVKMVCACVRARVLYCVPQVLVLLWLLKNTD